MSLPGTSRVEPSLEPPRNGSREPRSHRHPSATQASSTEPHRQEIGLPPIKPQDVLIAVMGVTGSGKSTFISHFCPEATVGHTLESCTSNVSAFHCYLGDGTSAYFVDTPGFDDTYKKDTDILREIADYLNKSYENKILLSGIVYLHRISDTRLGNSGMRNLRMFKKLVGEEGLANVVLATTMWSMVPDENVAISRESELTQTSDFWQYMICKGSKVFRQDRGLESAKKIVRHIVSRRKRAALDIQRDMIDKGLKLDETAAGQEVRAEFARQQAEHERRIAEIRRELQEAIVNKDKEHQEELREHKQDIEKQMRINECAIKRLKTSKEEIRREMEAKWIEEKNQLVRHYEDLQAQSLARQQEQLELARQQQQEQERQRQRQLKLFRQQQQQQQQQEQERQQHLELFQQQQQVARQPSPPPRRSSPCQCSDCRPRPHCCVNMINNNGPNSGNTSYQCGVTVGDYNCYYPPAPWPLPSNFYAMFPSASPYYDNYYSF